MTDERAHDVADLQLQLSALQAQLTDTQKQFESFVYAVSHDLRAPLRSISGFSQAILEMSQSDIVIDPKLNHFLSRIQQASGKLTEMIDGLLNLARLGRAEMHPRAVNLSRLCEESFAVIQTKYPHRQININITPNLSVKADARLLRTALDALLDNACKFTIDRSVAEITVTPVSNPDNSNGFCISDNGVGFDMNYLNKLFQPFQRLHSEPQYAGLGLGLVAAQRIIARHGGTIHAQATAEGTKIVCTLPS
jgi:light-regulated signal transduction histidine kinase (bacteriophytochrome)